MPPTLRGKVTLAITQHFPVDLHRSPLHHVAREPMIGSFNPMKSIKKLFQALGILALGFLVVGAIVWLLVDAILGGAL